MGALDARAMKRMVGYNSRRNWLGLRQIEAFTMFLEAANRKSRGLPSHHRAADTAFAVLGGATSGGGDPPIFSASGWAMQYAE